MALDPKKVEEWKAAVEKASPGPWLAHGVVYKGKPCIHLEASDGRPSAIWCEYADDGACVDAPNSVLEDGTHVHVYPDDPGALLDGSLDALVKGGMRRPEDAEFAAVAREAVPALLAEAERLQGEVVEMRALLGAIEWQGEDTPEEVEGWEEGFVCPMCRSRRPTHASDCCLAAALK
jgi:hypothetical protein